jgi:hypothetical protein
LTTARLWLLAPGGVENVALPIRGFRPLLSVSTTVLHVDNMGTKRPSEFEGRWAQKSGLVLGLGFGTGRERASGPNDACSAMFSGQSFETLEALILWLSDFVPKLTIFETGAIDIERRQDQVGAQCALAAFQLVHRPASSGHSGCTHSSRVRAKMLYYRRAGGHI